MFDKTGTLTSGVPHIHDLICYNERHLSARKLLGLASAESRLQHPVAEAIRTRTRNDEIEVPSWEEVQYRVGYGVEARINGHYLHLGSDRFLRENGIATAKAVKDQYDLNEGGCSSLFMAVDGKLAALIPYADQIRPESRDVIRSLNERGIKRDYHAMVCQKWMASFECAHLASGHARHLLKIDPQAQDACFVLAMTEYMVHRIPGFLRPFTPIEGIRGDLHRAIRHCQAVLHAGHYFQEFARRLLVDLYLDDGNRAHALHEMKILAAEYPGNRGIVRDLRKLIAGG